VGSMDVATRTVFWRDSQLLNAPKASWHRYLRGSEAPVQLTPLKFGICERFLRALGSGLLDLHSNGLVLLRWNVGLFMPHALENMSSATTHPHAIIATPLQYVSPSWHIFGQTISYQLL